MAYPCKLAIQHHSLVPWTLGRLYSVLFEHTVSMPCLASSLKASSPQIPSPNSMLKGPISSRKPSLILLVVSGLTSLEPLIHTPCSCTTSLHFLNTVMAGIQFFTRIYWVSLDSHFLEDRDHDWLISIFSVTEFIMHSANLTRINKNIQELTLEGNFTLGFERRPRS